MEEEAGRSGNTRGDHVDWLSLTVPSRDVCPQSPSSWVGPSSSVRWFPHPPPSWSPSPAEGGPEGRRQQSTPRSEQECGQRWGQASCGTCRPSHLAKPQAQGGQKRLYLGTGSRNVLVFSNT